MRADSIFEDVALEIRIHFDLGYDIMLQKFCKPDNPKHFFFEADMVFGEIKCGDTLLLFIVIPWWFPNYIEWKEEKRKTGAYAADLMEMD